MSTNTPNPGTPDEASQVIFSQILQLLKSLSDAVAGLTTQVQLLALCQDSIPSLSEQLFVELREFVERKKLKHSQCSGL